MPKKIGLIDVDGKSPNLALMKLSSWHKRRGDSVEWYNPLLSSCDKVYASKVFTFEPDYDYLPEGVTKGGSGYDVSKTLDDSIEHIVPDYSLYGIDYSMGFLTRGCIRKCQHCLVPEKEGAIHGHAEAIEFLRHKSVVLMDNNVLACEHGIRQIEKLGSLGVKVDFNQGLDARLIDRQVAKALAKLRWLKPIRLACDDSSMKKPVGRAVELLREAGATPSNYSCYVLTQDIEDAHDRVRFLSSIGVDPFAQPFRDFKNNRPPSIEQRRFARWVNHKATFKTVTWEEYHA